jgi:hypothetical protein
VVATTTQAVMDITQLHVDQYVQERYKELSRQRPEEKAAADHSNMKDLNPPNVRMPVSAVSRYEALLTSMQPYPTSSTFHASSSFEDKMQLHRVIQDLESLWPVTKLDKKHTLLYIILDNIATTTSRLTIDGNEIETAPSIAVYEDPNSVVSVRAP